MSPGPCRSRLAGTLHVATRSLTSGAAGRRGRTRLRRGHRRPHAWLPGAARFPRILGRGPREPARRQPVPPGRTPHRTATRRPGPLRRGDHVEPAAGAGGVHAARCGRTAVGHSAVGRAATRGGVRRVRPALEDVLRGAPVVCGGRGALVRGDVVARRLRSEHRVPAARPRGLPPLHATRPAAHGGSVRGAHRAEAAPPRGVRRAARRRRALAPRDEGSRGRCRRCRARARCRTRDESGRALAVRRRRAAPGGRGRPAVRLGAARARVLAPDVAGPGSLLGTVRAVCARVRRLPRVPYAEGCRVGLVA